MYPVCNHTSDSVSKSQQEKEYVRCQPKSDLSNIKFIVHGNKTKCYSLFKRLVLAEFHMASLKCILILSEEKISKTNLSLRKIPGA